MTKHVDQSLKHRLPERQTVIHPLRRWMFRVFVGSTTLFFFAILLLGPATMMGNNWSAIGVTVVALEIVLVVAGITWLSMLTLAGGRKYRSQPPN